MINVLFLLLSSIAFGAPAENGAPAEKATDAAASLKKSTDMSFDELLVQGQYHFTDEAVTTVESDKLLDGLLEVRKDFKDRIQQSATRF